MSRRTSRTRHALVAAACSAAAGAIALTAPAVAATVGVTVGNYYFEDGSVGDGQVTARVGDQLRFTVVEGAGHTVTIAALGIDSGQLASGAVYVTPALSTPGTYSLVCTTHRARNHATTLVVLAVDGSTTTNPPPTTPPSTTTSTSTSTPSTTDPGSRTPLGGTTAGGSGSGDSAGSGNTTAPGASDMSDIASDSGGPSGDEDADADDLLPVGVTGGDGSPWLRAVWIAFGTLPFFAVAAALAEWSARRRPQSGARAAGD